MFLYTLSAFSLAVFGLFTNGESMLPITICKHDSVDYSACLKSFLEESWPQFISGIPELNFPSLDPLFFKYGKAIFNSGEIYAEVIGSNISVLGLSKALFHDVRTYFFDDKFHLEIDLQCPSAFIEGAIKINGTIGVFKIVDNGNFNLTGEEVKGTWNLTGHIVNDTLIMEHFRANPIAKKVKIYVNNTFQGNKELNNLISSFINEFWPSLFRTVSPIIFDLCDPWLVDIVNNIFLKVPFSKLFP